MTDKQKQQEIVESFKQWIDDQTEISNLEHAKVYLHHQWDEAWFDYDPKRFLNYRNCPDVPEELSSLLENKWQQLNKN